MASGAAVSVLPRFYLLAHPRGPGFEDREVKTRDLVLVEAPGFSAPPVPIVHPEGFSRLANCGKRSFS